MMPSLLLVVGCVQPEIPLPPGATALDRAIVAELQAERVPGLQAAVYHGPDVVFQGAWGLADADSGRRVDGDTLFTIASLSKLVTTVAVMQLVEAGAVDLDADVDGPLGFSVRHPSFPEVPITARYLLTHTSGIEDDWPVMNEHYTDGDPGFTIAEFLEGYVGNIGPFAADAFGRHQPGTRFRYSNIGVALAGLLVERVEGRDFAEVCEERIFAPMEMNATGWAFADVDADRLAMPTEWRRGWRALGHEGVPDYPSGSLKTTATELAAFMGAAVGHSEVLLEPDTVAEMLRVQVPALEPEQALGFFRWELDDEWVVGHDGAEAGLTSEGLSRPGRGDGVVVLANGELSFQGFQEVERLIFEQYGAP